MHVSKTIQRRLLFVAGLLGAAGVGFGAFGAHGLEQSSLRPELIEAYRTGSLYHLLHVPALVLCALAAPLCRPLGWRAAVFCFLGGIFLFSGSLYAMAFAELAGTYAGFLGPVTPTGGLLLLLGWLFLGLSARGKED
jgi:uncharacterized membrane protein YgdD (TMEM256/DUF423 family)